MKSETAEVVIFDREVLSVDQVTPAVDGKTFGKPDDARTLKFAADLVESTAYRLAGRMHSSNVASLMLLANQIWRASERLNKPGN